jgi:hypothetical protein
MPARSRQRAAECLRQAQNKRLNLESRMLLLDMAEAWVRLADLIEERQSSVHSGSQDIVHLAPHGIRH